MLRYRKPPPYIATTLSLQHKQAVFVGVRWIVLQFACRAELVDTQVTTLFTRAGLPTRGHFSPQTRLGCEGISPHAPPSQRTFDTLPDPRFEEHTRAYSNKNVVWAVVGRGSTHKTLYRKLKTISTRNSVSRGTQTNKHNIQTHFPTEANVSKKFPNRLPGFHGRHMTLPATSPIFT